MNAQARAMSAQAIALHKQNSILQKEHERQIEKEFKDRIFQLRLHLAQATDESQRFVIQQMLSEAEEDYENYQREQAEKRLADAKKRKIWLIFSSIVAVLGMVGLYFMYQDISQVTVPELYGVELSEAKDLLYEEGLKVGTITEVGGQPVQPGVVSMSSPSGGTKVKRGSTVNLIIAEDTEEITALEESSTSEVTTSNIDGSSQSSSQSKTEKSNPSTVATTTLWNESKSEQLYNYIVSDWGVRMNQTYQSYTEEAPLNYYGVTVPNAILNPSGDSSQFTGMKPDFNGETPYLVWSEDGNSASNGYALVAVYADTEHVGASPSSHLYLFTINNGTTQVWVTEQNQGNPDQTLYFRETQNTELKNYFSQLVSQ
ncbi:TPA: DUF4767 domain-containing protein [Streptococcus suis]